MYGKVMKVSEYELKFGAREQLVNVFWCFKYLKNGNSYVIYSMINNEVSGKIYFGLFHKDKNKGKIVSLEPKLGDEEIIKEAIWNLVNNQKLDYYQSILINDIDKMEIIGNGTMDVKIDVIEKLKDITIPKKEENTEVVVERKKHPILRFFISLLVLAVGLASFVFSYNIGEYLGYGKVVTCQKNYSHIKLDADIERVITIYYDRNNKFDKLIDNTAYIFNKDETYYKFREEGEYFAYQPNVSQDSKSDSGISWNNDANTFRTIVNIKGESEYYVDSLKVEGDINKDYNNLTNDNYVCTIKDREE